MSKEIKRTIPVFTAKAALEEVNKIKKFLEEKVIGQQMQSIKNQELSRIKSEEQEKMKETKLKDERKLADKRAKEEKEKQTDDLIKSAY